MDAPHAVEHYDHEAYEREYEREVHGGETCYGSAVDDAGLDGRQYRSAEDGHDEAGGSEFGIVTESLESYTVDGGEHDGHAGRYTHEAVQTHASVHEDDAGCECHATCGEDGKEASGIDVAEQIGEDETVAAEYGHGYDVVLLRQHFGAFFIHPFVHEHACAILDDECPAHDLSSYVEELGYDTLAVTAQREYALEALEEMHVVGVIAVGRHPHEPDHKEHYQHHKTYEQVGGDEHHEVGIAHSLKLGIAQRGAGLGLKRIELGLDKLHSHPHAGERAYGVECLGEIQSAHRGAFRSHGEDIGITARLEKRETAGEDEVGYEERIVTAGEHGRIEQECSDGIEAESGEHTGLVGVAANEYGRREGHGEISAVEGHLDERAVGDAHAEYLGESLYHGVGYVVGKPPQCKAAGDEYERYQIIDTVVSQ